MFLHFFKTYFFGDPLKVIHDPMVMRTTAVLVYA